MDDVLGLVMCYFWHLIYHAPQIRNKTTELAAHVYLECQSNNPNIVSQLSLADIRLTCSRSRHLYIIEDISIVVITYKAIQIKMLG